MIASAAVASATAIGAFAAGQRAVPVRMGVHGLGHCIACAKGRDAL